MVTCNRVWSSQKDSKKRHKEEGNVTKKARKGRLMLGKPSNIRCGTLIEKAV